jgi:hypothetical protein
MKRGSVEEHEGAGDQGAGARGSRSTREQEHEGAGARGNRSTREQEHEGAGARGSRSTRVRVRVRVVIVYFLTLFI